MLIAEKFGIFNVYNGTADASGKVAGVTDEMELPNFEYMSETIKLSGMLGEVDSPALGQIKSTQIEIPLATISEEGMQLAQDDSKPIILRATQEILDTETYQKRLAIRAITVKGMTKAIKYGKLKKGGYADASITKELVYYKDEFDGKVLSEVDKFNGKLILNGKNMLEEVEPYI